MKDKKSESARTEMIHGDDLDYPLDVPSKDEAATTAFPAANPHARSSSTAASDSAGERTSVDALAPLPFGDHDAARPEVHDARTERRAGRGTTELGLVVLRIVVGALLGMRGLQKLFGLLDGPGVDGFSDILAHAGFRQADVLAVAGGAVELVAALALVVGLATPVAASALLGIVGLGLAVQISQPGTPPILGDTTKGLETSILYGGALFALLFTGPGRWSIDRRWRWSHRPRWSGFLWLLVAVAGAVLVWYLLNGSNPLTSPADSTPVPAR